jgi:hypothetical protein
MSHYTCIACLFSILNWLCSGDKSPVCHHAVPGSIPLVSICNLWWAKCHRNGFFSKYLGPPPPISVIPPLLHACLLTPWCRVLVEKPTGLQLVKKFPAFYGTRRFIPHSQASATCPCPGPAQSSPHTHIPHHCFILILFICHRRCIFCSWHRR